VVCALYAGRGESWPSSGSGRRRFLFAVIDGVGGVVVGGMGSASPRSARNITGRKLLAKLNQYPCHRRIDPTQQMTRWDAPFQVEHVKQMALVACLPTHHGKSPPLIVSSRRNHCSSKITSPFSTPSAITGSDQPRY